MPNKTIYVKDSDLKMYEKAQQAGSISSRFSQYLRSTYPQFAEVVPGSESVNTPLSMHNENEGRGDCVVRIHYDERMTASEYYGESVGAMMCSIVDKVGKAFAVDATTVVRWMSESTFWKEWKMDEKIKR
jgi:hypothetical protein